MRLSFSKNWKKVWKLSKLGFKSILFLMVLYFILAVGLAFIPVNQKSKCTDSQVFLSTNGMHVDIVLPINQINDSIRQSLQLGDKVQYVGFGWGDKAFYLETETWDDFSISTTLQALLLKSESALHITAYYRESDAWKYYNTCEEQVMALNQYLDDTFLKDENGKYQYISDGYHSNDSFYAAKGSYSCVNTCNHWIGRGLKKAKLRTALWSPFDFGLMQYARK